MPTTSSSRRGRGAGRGPGSAGAGRSRRAAGRDRQRLRRLGRAGRAAVERDLPGIDVAARGGPGLQLRRGGRRGRREDAEHEREKHATAGHAINLRRDVARGPPPRLDEPVPAACDGPARRGHDRPSRSRAARPLVQHSSPNASALLRDPLPLLLDAYERYGPVFTLADLPRPLRSSCSGRRPTTTSLVSQRRSFSWREGHMGDLIPLLGDGLLTIDGEFHRRSRKAMLPAFHRERIAAVDRRSCRRRPRRRSTAARRPAALDLYRWTGGLALRIAHAARSSASTPTPPPAGVDAAEEFEHALGFWSRRLLPADHARAGIAVHPDAAGAPRARRASIHAGIDRRRRPASAG